MHGQLFGESHAKANESNVINVESITFFAISQEFYLAWII
jgi:hypothetical protein